MKILNVTDFHIGALYSGVALSPEQFIEIAGRSTTLEEFVQNARLPARSPMARFAQYIEQADSIVLTGDMIDFINQPAHCDDMMMKRVGIAFHKLLLASAGNREVYEVLGNHERVKKYEKALQEMEDEHENYHVNFSHFKIGDALFIHGDRDLAPHSMEGELAYEKRTRERHRRPVGHMIETFAGEHLPGAMIRFPKVHTFLERHLSKVVTAPNPLLYTAKHQVELMFHNLNARLGDVFGDVKHVFLGHTHIPYTGLEYEYGGHSVMFHNGGGAIKANRVKDHIEFNPLMITVEDGVVKNVKTLSETRSRAGGRG